MSSHPVSGQTTLLSRTRIDMAAHDMLRLFVGRGRKWSVVDLATASHVAARKIECARCEPGDPEHRPLDREELLSVMSVLGAPAQSVMLSLMGTAAHDVVSIEMDPAGLIRLLVEGGAEFVKRGVDGIFCNGDRGDLRPWADQMIAALAPYSSKAQE